MHWADPGRFTLRLLVSPVSGCHGQLRLWHFLPPYLIFHVFSLGQIQCYFFWLLAPGCLYEAIVILLLLWDLNVGLTMIEAEHEIVLFGHANSIDLNFFLFLISADISIIFTCLTLEWCIHRFDHILSDALLAGTLV